jgi:dTDP-glucose pyrophosphorylase
MTGVMLPKPLIPVDGMPMFQKALSSSIPEIGCLTVIILKAHNEKFALEKTIKAFNPRANAIIIDHVTQGPTETCLNAAPFLSSADSVLCLDCDLWFRSSKFLSSIESVLAGNSASGGSVLYFKSSSPRYSYAQIGSDNEVLKTAEKEVISENALVGAYFFSKCGDFLEAAEQQIRNLPSQQNKEATIAPLFNRLISHGLAVSANPIDRYFSFGTPEELASYNKRGA